MILRGKKYYAKSLQWMYTTRERILRKVTNEILLRKGTNRENTTQIEYYADRIDRSSHQKVQSLQVPRQVFPKRERKMGTQRA